MVLEMVFGVVGKLVTCLVRENVLWLLVEWKHGQFCY